MLTTPSLPVHDRANKILITPATDPGRNVRRDVRRMEGPESCLEHTPALKRLAATLAVRMARNTARHTDHIGTALDHACS